MVLKEFLDTWLGAEGLCGRGWGGDSKKDTGLHFHIFPAEDIPIPTRVCTYELVFFITCVIIPWSCGYEMP